MSKGGYHQKEEREKKQFHGGNFTDWFCIEQAIEYYKNTQTGVIPFGGGNKSSNICPNRPQIPQNTPRTQSSKGQKKVPDNNPK
jgi:hypothetical protein